MTPHLPRAGFFVIAMALMGCAAQAAPVCRGGRIYTHCSDDMAFLRGQCSAYPFDSPNYAPCMARADQNVRHSCQRYRVPCDFEGGFFDNFSLGQYPKVGAPSPLEPGFAPVGGTFAPSR